jgi:hypothetical protein
MRLKWIIVIVVFAVATFLTGVTGPLGSVLGWRPAPGIPEPIGVQLPLLILLALLESLALGFGVAFLLFGYPSMRAAGPAPAALTRAAHLSIVWVLINWWSHDSFHIANGLELGGLLAIEYVFHVTLMIAGTIAAWWFLTVIRGYRAQMVQS